MARDYDEYDPFDSSNDTTEQFRERAARLRELGYANAADECDAAAAKLEQAA